jgi:hypothetical protein
MGERRRGTLAAALLLAVGACAPTGSGIAERSAAVTVTSTSASNDDTTVSYGLTYTGTHSFFRVYVDADQSASTGLAVGGVWAEFLVENGALYRYTGDGNSWSWARVTTAVGFANTGAAASWRVARADLGETAPCTEAANLVFDVDDSRSAVVTQVYAPSASCAPAPPPAGAPISSPSASNDATNVSYSFSYAGAPNFFRVYVDADLNAATGFAAVPGVGADYLLENGFLYAHTGTGWSWSSLGSVSFSAASQVARWTVSRARIGETALCGERSTLAFQTEDTAIHSSAPVTETFTNDPSCGAPPPPPPPAGGHVNYVFVIAMENEPAAAIYGSPSAPYINGTIIPRYARATAFVDPLPDALPSEPHYVWMEAGTNAFADATFTGDGDPSASNSTASTAHLVTQMGAATPPVSWLSYQEGLSAATGACPVTSAGLYAAKHDPFVFFQDVAGSPPSPASAFCADHHRAYTTSGFASDLARLGVARYDFITPNLCNDMHGAAGCPGGDVIRAGDDWLAANLPPLIDFVTAQSGVIFIVWDEPAGGSNLIPFLAIGPHVKAGYAGPVTYTHSSLVRSVEAIFGLPVLPAVIAATDFGDLFQPGFFP